MDVGFRETLGTVFLIFIQLKSSKIQSVFLKTKKEGVTVQAQEMEERGSTGDQPGSKG